MRRNQTLSQRAQTSVTAPRSCVSEGSSQTPARGCRFGTKTKSANSAAAQVAARVQRKISVGTPRTRCPADTARDDTRMAARHFTPDEANALLVEVRPV